MVGVAMVEAPAGKQWAKPVRTGKAQDQKCAARRFGCDQGKSPVVPNTEGSRRHWRSNGEARWQGQARVAGMNQWLRRSGMPRSIGASQRGTTSRGPGRRAHNQKPVGSPHGRGALRRVGKVGRRGAEATSDGIDKAATCRKQRRGCVLAERARDGRAQVSARSANAVGRTGQRRG